MELIEVIDRELIKYNINADNKNDAIRKICELLYERDYISNVDGFYEDVIKREELGETGIGNGIAIPHGKSSCVNKNTIAIFKLDKEIEWETLDGKGVKVIILFAVQDDIESAKEHLRLLASVARKLGKEEIISSLLEAKNEYDIIKCFE